MTVLEAHGIAASFSASIAVLEDVSFVLEPGFAGLVGANGAGKTTLLRILAGELAPDAGSVRLRPADATIAYCPQLVESRSADVEALALREDRLAAALRGRLALDAGELERWRTLSPGERKRWQIGAALARDPDVLLLDEPTNHLDGDARARLLDALARFRGVGVVVSHDRGLLDRLPRMILRVHGGRVDVLPGNLAAARELWEGARRRTEEAHERARSNVRALERRLDAARRTREATTRATSTRARMKDRNDSDARGTLAKNLARWADARAGRTVGVVRGELARARQEVPAIARDSTAGAARLFATYTRAPQPIAFHLEATEVRPDDGRGPVVLRDVRVTIGRDERVRIAGPNGAGKTSLLAALLATRRADVAAGRILHLPQELPEASAAALVSGLRSLPEAERGRVLSVFGALGSDPERLASRRAGSDAQISPGEARKLALATGLGRHAWALVLDEPTNHLDLPTIERLERALEDYPGCVVLVTHDDAFAAGVKTARVLAVRGGAIE